MDISHLFKFICFSCLISLFGCSLLEKKEPDPTFEITKNPLTPEQSQRLTGEVGGNFLYGQGFGELLVAVGGILITPWYAVYALGNGVVALSGYKPLHITNLLPPQTKSGYDSFYDSVTSGPGRLSGYIAGEKYRTPEIIKQRYQTMLTKFEEQNKENTDQKRNK